MSGSNPVFRTAGDREAEARCAHCNLPLVRGEELAGCPKCGAVHHVACWQAQDGCSSFDCAPARRILGEGQPPSLRVTREDVDRAVPLPKRPAMSAGFVPQFHPSPPELEPRRRSRMAIAALVVALAGIPLFGVVTGLVAIFLGALALGAIHQTRQRGTGLAVSGILLGMVDMIAWIIFLMLMFSRPHFAIDLNDFEPDANALNHLSPRIARAIRANVLIESHHGILGGGIGSGVILDIQDGSALIVTNRHVVDPNFGDDESHGADAALPDERLQVKLIGQPLQAGRVVWIAPDGIDLALLTVAAEGADCLAAYWEPKRELLVGADVFSIGNPQHLDWTHTRGSISQLRLQRRGNRQIHVIQTDAPLNPGNSGGGLYDKDGILLGINTWTNDKRFSEGLGFAIALDSLLSLDPSPLQGKAGQKPEAKPEEE